MARDRSSSSPLGLIIVLGGLAATAALVVASVLRSSGVRVPAGLVERSPLDHDAAPLEHIRTRSTPLVGEGGSIFGHGGTDPAADPVAAPVTPGTPAEASPAADLPREGHAGVRTGAPATSGRGDAPGVETAEEASATMGDRDAAAGAEPTTPIAEVAPEDLARLDPHDTASLEEVESVRPLVYPPEAGAFEHRGTAYAVAELEPRLWKVTDPKGLNVGTLQVLASTGEGSEPVFVTALPEGERLGEGSDWPTLVAQLINERLAE